MNTYPGDRTLNRHATVYHFTLVGGGLGAAPTVDAEGAASNIFRTITRNGPGNYTLTLRDPVRNVRVESALYRNTGYDTTRAHKTLLIKGEPIDNNVTTIDLRVEPTGGTRFDELTDPLAVGTAALEAATATTVSPRTVLAAGLLTAGKNELLARPRNVTFTVAGGTAAHAPTSAVITGTGINGDALTETVAITASAGTYEGAKAFRTITSVVYGAASGTGATVAVGYGKKFGLSVKAKVRAGAVVRLVEIAAGSYVTNGTLATPTASPPNGSYSPNGSPNGADDYALGYEIDGGIDLLTTEAFNVELALFRGKDL
ncbi:MAG: hypothetical protein EBS48_10285 [Actinobacteria bacterium]|nr:hypothetical protein [Actinomycetota bacterium]